LLAAAKEPAIANEPRHDALGHTCLEMSPARSTMTEMRADKLSGAAPRVHRKNSPIFCRHLPISLWELYCDARKIPGAEASMNMAEDSEHFDETCTHAERLAVAAWSQIRRQCSVICLAPFAPSHTPRVFPTAQGERLRPRIGPQARCGAIYFGGTWAGSPRLKASAAHSAPSCGSCIDCSGRSIPHRGAWR
jgi:hypothetical protein